MNTPQQAPGFPQQPIAQPHQSYPRQQPPPGFGQAPPAAPYQPAPPAGQYPQQAAPGHPQAAPYQAPPRQTRGKGTMIAGAVLGAIGAIITVVTFLTADPGGTFVVAFGPMIAGIALFVRGLINYLASRVG